MSVGGYDIIGIDFLSNKNIVIAVYDTQYTSKIFFIKFYNRIDNIWFSLTINKFALLVVSRHPKSDIVLAFDDQNGAIVRSARHFDFSCENTRCLVFLSHSLETVLIVQTNH